MRRRPDLHAIAWTQTKFPILPDIDGCLDAVGNACSIWLKKRGLEQEFGPPTTLRKKRGRPGEQAQSTPEPANQSESKSNW